MCFTRGAPTLLSLFVLPCGSFLLCLFCHRTCGALDVCQVCIFLVILIFGLSRIINSSDAVSLSIAPWACTVLQKSNVLPIKVPCYACMCRFNGQENQVVIITTCKSFSVTPFKHDMMRILISTIVSAFS